MEHYHHSDDFHVASASTPLPSIVANHSAAVTSSTTTAPPQEPHRIHEDENDEPDTAFRHVSPPQQPQPQLQQKDDTNINHDNFSSNHDKIVSVVRYVMTFLLLLFILAAILSILSMKQYRFVVTLLWILLIFLFLGFCAFIDETVMRNPTLHNHHSHRRRGLFHPIIPTIVHDYIVAGFTDFIHDCHTYDYRNHMGRISNTSAWDTTTDDNTGADDAPRSSRPPRTKLFRILVVPPIRALWAFRTRHRRRPPSTTTATELDQPNDANDPQRYVPPPSVAPPII